MTVMESKLMASQAFPVCYFAEGYLSDLQDSASRPSRYST